MNHSLAFFVTSDNLYAASCVKKSCQIFCKIHWFTTCLLILNYTHSDNTAPNKMSANTKKQLDPSTTQTAHKDKLNKNILCAEAREAKLELISESHGEISTLFS